MEAANDDGHRKPAANRIDVRRQLGPAWKAPQWKRAERRGSGPSSPGEQAFERGLQLNDRPATRGLVLLLTVAGNE